MEVKFPNWKCSPFFHFTANRKVFWINLPNRRMRCRIKEALAVPNRCRSFFRVQHTITRIIEIINKKSWSFLIFFCPTPSLFECWQKCGADNLMTIVSVFFPRFFQVINYVPWMFTVEKRNILLGRFLLRGQVCLFFVWQLHTNRQTKK